MAISITVNAALGVTGALTHERVTDAISAAVREDDMLDWKRVVSDDNAEIAKDIAAMANARGGALIYGVAEQRRTSAAVKALPIDLSDSLERRIRSIAANIQPSIDGLVVESLPDPDDADHGFLAVTVPASADAPHLVATSQQGFGIPRRHGTQTIWLNEWDLERAYRQRFARRASEEDRLDALISSALGRVDAHEHPWFIAASMLTAPAVGAIGSAVKTDAVNIISSADGIAAAIADRNYGGRVLSGLGNSALNPRIGLRRWISRDVDESALSGPSFECHVEIHTDGSTVVATNAGRWNPPAQQGKHVSISTVIEAIAIDTIATVAATAEYTATAAQSLIRVALVGGSDLPHALAVNERPSFNVWHQPPWSNDVHTFFPVDFALPALATIEQLREAAAQLAADVASQFGVPAEYVRW